MLWEFSIGFLSRKNYLELLYCQGERYGNFHSKHCEEQSPCNKEAFQYRPLCSSFSPLDAVRVQTETERKFTGRVGGKVLVQWSAAHITDFDMDHMFAWYRTSCFYRSVSWNDNNKEMGTKCCNCHACNQGDNRLNFVNKFRHGKPRTRNNNKKTTFKWHIWKKRALKSPDGEFRDSRESQMTQINVMCTFCGHFGVSFYYSLWAPITSLQWVKCVLHLFTRLLWCNVQQWADLGLWVNFRGRRLRTSEVQEQGRANAAFKCSSSTRFLETRFCLPLIK